MTDYAKVSTACLKEMFKRVGMAYPDEEFTKQKDWFSKKTWTQRQEDSFRLWMDKYLTKHCRHWTKQRRQKELEYFLLAFGWRVQR